MQNPTVPIVKELVLIGGGHTHALVLRAWGMRPVPGVRLTLINPGPTAPYSGMLPGHIAGHYDRAALEIDLIRLARFAGSRVILGAADHIDPEARVVHVPGRTPIWYDICSVDVGITAKMDDLPGFAAHGIPAKPLDTFAKRWAAFCEREGAARITILGGGVAGVELSLAAAHRMQALGRATEVTVLDRGTLLDGVAPRARARLLRAMTDWGVEGLSDAAPVAVSADGVTLEDGRQIASDFTIGAAGAVPHPWLAASGLTLQNGYIAVDAQLRSVSHPDVYAVGDCAHLTHAPRPKAGVFAVRAAPVLGWNLRAQCTGKSPKTFHPQRDFLKLISLGDKKALAERGGIALHGAAMWRWKDRIDQSFMDKFRHLPEMPKPKLPKGAATLVAAELSGPQPCGGCGAKLGSDALGGVLDGAPGDDAAVEAVGGAQIVLTHDHLRAFAEDPALVAKVAAVHAMGDVWAMGAAPKSALAQVILPRLTDRLQRRWLDEIMGAAEEVFAAAGAQIIGGHSTMGAELTLGFTVRGALDRPAIGLQGATPGDALILSRGIGSGVVLAAEMRGLAGGEDVAAVWAQMARPQADAAAVLAPLAHAMTDVTGFGLAGHLQNICAASEVGAEIMLDRIPCLPGALDLAAQGTRSTLYPQNRAALAQILRAPETPRANLIYDPQTSGGLLAAVPAKTVTGALNALRALGHDAAHIGDIRTAAHGLTAV